MPLYPSPFRLPRFAEIATNIAAGVIVPPPKLYDERIWFSFDAGTLAGLQGTPSDVNNAVEGRLGRLAQDQL